MFGNDVVIDQYNFKFLIAAISSQPFLSLKSSSCTLYRKLPLTGRYFQNSKVFPKFVFRILEEYPSEKFSFQPETVVQMCSVERLFLISFAMFTDKHLHYSLFFVRKWQTGGLWLYWKETLTQVFSCKSWKIFKSNYSEEHLQLAASFLLFLQ